MSVALQGTPSLYENASATSVVLPYPAGVTAGEVLIATVTHSTLTAPTTSPGGTWTLIASRNSIASEGPSIAVWSKVAVGGETGSVTFATNATASRVTGHMFRFSGVNTTTIEDVTEVTAIANSLTLTTPTMTTATNNAMLLTVLAINAGSTADITGPAGPTAIANTTGIGRRTKVFAEQWPTAGVTGTRTWQTTITLPFTGIMLALRSSNPGSSGVNAPRATASGLLRPPIISATGPQPPILIRSVNDIPGQNSMAVAVNSTNTVSVRLKVGTNSAVTTGVIWGPAATPDSEGNAQVTVSGLTPGVSYYYRVAMTNSASIEVLDDWSAVGQFKTSPTSGNFSFAFSSCTNGSDSTAMAAVAVKKPEMFLHLGDEYYADGSGSAISNYRTQMGNKKTATNFKAVYRTSGSSLTPSDHDFMNNNANAGNTTTAAPNWNQVYREMNPTTDLPGSMGVYRTWTYGRVRFIRIDRRSFAYSPASVDGPAKTCLGTTQKQWLKDQITQADEPVIVIQNADPWIIATTAGDDGWGGFTYERDELAAHFAASGKNIVMLGGDMHALAADDGGNSPGGVAVFQASPLNNAASQKGGPYDVGPYPSTAGATVSQYGWVDVVDTGAQISLVFKGFSADNTQRLTLTKTYDAPTPAQDQPLVVRGGALVAGTVSSVRGGVLVPSSQTFVVQADTPPAPGTWTLAFEDDFLGTTLSNKWANSWFQGGVMNGVTTSPANVRVSGGNLILTPASSSSGALVNTNPIDGGAPAGGFTYTSGYAEARIFFPGIPDGSRAYNWPAWWTTGQTWPTTGEIDIAEPLAGVMHSNYHSAGADFNHQISGSWANGWHKYGVHRKTNGTNDIYFDDVLVYSYSTSDGNAPHYLVLNVGYSASYPMYGVDGEMKVDWVRVWV